LQAKKNRIEREEKKQGPSKEQLLDLKRVQEERVASEKLRILGVKPKEGLGIFEPNLTAKIGVRYERKDLRQEEDFDRLDSVFRL
jgi:hypothetical protein